MAVKLKLVHGCHGIRNVFARASLEGGGVSVTSSPRSAASRPPAGGH